MPVLTVAAPMMMPQIATMARPRLIQPDQRPGRLKTLMVSTACVRIGSDASCSPSSSSSSSASSMISRLRKVAVSRLDSRTATYAIHATNSRISTIASTVVTSFCTANTNRTSGARAKTTMYSRGMLNRGRREDRAQREHDAAERHGGADDEAERDVLIPLQVQGDPEDDVVELDPGEDDRQQEDRDRQPPRDADERADQPLGAVDQQRRAGDEDEDRGHARGSSRSVGDMTAHPSGFREPSARPGVRRRLRGAGGRRRASSRLDDATGSPAEVRSPRGSRGVRPPDALTPDTNQRPGSSTCEVRAGRRSPRSCW